MKLHDYVSDNYYTHSLLLVRCYFQSSSMLVSEICLILCSLLPEHMHPHMVYHVTQAKLSDILCHIMIKIFMDLL
jgi:hypothetical protein